MNVEIIDFWEACVHQYLYVRRVYPEALFVQQMLYGAHVWFSPQPDINRYVKRVLKNASALLDLAIVDRLELTVTSSSTNITVERFFLSCSPPTTGPEQEEDKYDKYDQLEAEMRAALLKIALTGSLMRALPDDCTFALALATKQCNSADDRGAIDAALRCGEWKVEGVKQPAAASSPPLLVVKAFHNSLVGSIQLLVQTAVSP